MKAYWPTLSLSMSVLCIEYCFVSVLYTKDYCLHNSNQCYTYIKIKSTACPYTLQIYFFTTSVKFININIIGFIWKTVYKWIQETSIYFGYSARRRRFRHTRVHIVAISVTCLLAMSARKKNVSLYIFHLFWVILK